MTQMPRIGTFSRARSLPLAAAAVGLALHTLAACGSRPTILGGSNTVISQSSGSTLQLPSGPGFSFVDAGSNRDQAQFFVTDFPEDLWDLEDDLTERSGVIVHVTAFMGPEEPPARLTREAVTAAVRVLVLSRGEVGVYGGAGSWIAGDGLRGGSLRLGTLRLVRQTPGFVDALGPSAVALTLRTEPNTQKARDLEAVFAALAAEARVQPASTPTPTTP